jgi:hypothetical protein
MWISANDTGVDSGNVIHHFSIGRTTYQAHIAFATKFGSVTKAKPQCHNVASITHGTFHSSESQ